MVLGGRGGGLGWAAASRLFLRGTSDSWPDSGEGGLGCKRGSLLTEQDPRDRSTWHPWQALPEAFPLPCEPMEVFSRCSVG